jgi:ABC-type sugar transport system substrate-binding protein
MARKHSIRSGARWTPFGRAAVLLALGVVVVTAAGCGSSDSSSSGGGSADAGDAKGKSVVLLGCTNANPWCAAFNKSLETGLEGKGVKVTTQTTNFDPVVQSQQAAQAISQHPAAILSHVADPTAAASWMRRAKAAGIDVIAVDADIGAVNRDLVTANLMPDHCKLGEFAAQNIQEGLEKQGVSSGNVIVIAGTESQIHVQTRLECFEKELGKTPDLKIVETQDGNWDPIKTGTIAQQLFAKWRGKGGIQAAYGMADYQAAAISRVAEQAGLPLYPKDAKGMVVTGSNCADVGLKAIDAGTMYGGATQSPILEGQDFVPYIVKVLGGGTIGRKITTPVERITKANAAKYAKSCSI